MTSAKIADDAVTSAKIDDDTIANADIASGADIAATKIAGTAIVADPGGPQTISGNVSVAGNASFTGQLNGPNRFRVEALDSGVLPNETLSTAAPHSRVNADSFHTNGLGPGQMYIEARFIDANNTIAIGTGRAGVTTPENVLLGKDLTVTGNATVSGSQTIDGALTVSGTATVSGGIKNGFLTSRSFSFSGQSSGGGAIDEVVYSVPSGALYGGKRGYVRWMCHNRGNAASNEVGTRFFIYATDQAGLNPTSIVSGDPSTAVNPRWNGQDLVVTVPQYWNCTIEVSGT